jgi:hypothetical protein
MFAMTSTPKGVSLMASRTSVKKALTAAAIARKPAVTPAATASAMQIRKASTPAQPTVQWKAVWTQMHGTSTLQQM